jgi:hypothetical protein
MSNQPSENNDMPAEIDFSKGIRGLHHIPSGAKVLMPACIEKSVWEYFIWSGRGAWHRAFGTPDRSAEARYRNHEALK